MYLKIYFLQVSKTAPTGEYLSTGSFMIRGKKNFLPPCYLVYGFGFLFKVTILLTTNNFIVTTIVSFLTLTSSVQNIIEEICEIISSEQEIFKVFLYFKVDEDSVFRHKGERRVRALEEDSVTTYSDVTDVTDQVGSDNDEEEEEEGGDTDTESTNDKLEDIEESDSEEAEKAPTDSGEKNDTGDVSKEVKGGAALENGKEAENDPSDSDDSDGELQFPDTSIKLQHVKGDKWVQMILYFIFL